MKSLKRLFRYNIRRSQNVFNEYQISHEPKLSIYKLHVSLSQEDYDKYRDKILNILSENNCPHFKCTDSAALCKQIQKHNNGSLQRLLSGDQFTIYIPENYDTPRLCALCNQIEDALINCAPGKHLDSELKLTEHINMRQEKINVKKLPEVQEYPSSTEAVQQLIDAGHGSFKYQRQIYYIDQETKKASIIYQNNLGYIPAIPAKPQEVIASAVCLMQLKKSKIYNDLNDNLIQKYTQVCQKYIAHLEQTSSDKYAEQKKKIINDALRKLNDKESPSAERIQNFRQKIIEGVKSQTQEFDFFARRDNYFVFFLKIVGVVLSCGFAYDTLFGEKATEERRLLKGIGISIYKAKLNSYKQETEDITRNSSRERGKDDQEFTTPNR